MEEILFKGNFFMQKESIDRKEQYGKSMSDGPMWGSTLEEEQELLKFQQISLLDFSVRLLLSLVWDPC